MEYVTEKDRIYARDGAGKIVAEITFPTHNGVSTITHTFVDNSLRGQGIAAQLVERAVDKIKDDGHEIAATCTYALRWLQRHP